MDKVPTVFGFTLIISTVGSYQVSLSIPNSGNSSTSKLARPSVMTDNKASYIGLDAVGPCMGLSVHVPHRYLKVVFN